jgi:uncharacterized protein with von Willebrand factor type A (vWA) domain
MKRVKYSRWDGTQTWRELEEEELAERLFKELSNYMNWSLSAQEAMEWLMRQGIDLPDLNIRVMGTDELLQELRRQRQEAFQQYNFDHALDDINDKVREIVEREVKTARGELGSIHPEFMRREEALRTLPQKASEAIDKLAEYDASMGFLDEEAKRLFDELMAQRETVQELEQFILRHGRQFQGPESLDFEQAAALMARFKQMADLAEALRTGNFQEISLEEFKEALGEDAIQSIVILSTFADKLEESGYIQRTDDGIRLTPRGFRQIGQNALNEIFRNMRKDRFGLHPQEHRGVSRRNVELSVPYEFGKPLDIDIMGTLKNALRRGATGGRIRLQGRDFEVFEEDHDTQVTTVLMLDMSWSMSRDGRFPAAKRVALAMDHLIRMIYPRDQYYTIGFSTRARELTPEQLTEATWDPSDPFTNIQEGLWLSRQLFRQHRSTNRQIIIITDGQPTATHINGYTNAQWPGFMGSIPPDIYRETLKEVDNCTRDKVTINVFMLDDNPVLVKFVEEMVRVNRGRAFYSLPHNLGKYLLVDYLNRRRKQIA